MNSKLTPNIFLARLMQMILLKLWRLSKHVCLDLNSCGSESWQTIWTMNWMWKQSLSIVESHATTHLAFWRLSLEILSNPPLKCVTRNPWNYSCNSLWLLFHLKWIEVCHWFKCWCKNIKLFQDICVLFSGISVNGTKIVLQLLLAFHKPSLMLDLMSRASELITENVNRVPIIQTLLWVLAQPSFKDTCTGVQGEIFEQKSWIY